MSIETTPARRVAIVVGAGGELGRATAMILAERGMTVVGVDRNEEGLDQLPDGILRELADATDPDAASPAVDRIARDVGVPATLVNTIGAFQTGDALTTTPETLHEMIDVNLGPALWFTQAMVPHMKANGAGAIVHIAARPGIDPTAGMAAYSASKAALVHLTRILDVELRPSGIRVNCVAPQLLDTAFARATFQKDVLVHAVAPEAIAEVVAFLVSDAASPISGAVLPAYGF